MTDTRTTHHLGAIEALADMAPINDDPVCCEMCDGLAAHLGTLGSTDHYRCACCGWTFSQRSEA